MKTDQPSTTAENNAVIRAFESMRPPDERIFFDPYAAYFLPDVIRKAENTHAALGQRISEWQQEFPGICDAIVARTRFFDDCLRKAIDKETRQLVILGAGFDTRALRFGRLLENLRIFEVDHPATQRVKRERYLHDRLPVPGQVVFLPVNFEKHDLGNILVANGYDPSLKSIFIWEGMTYYVPAECVDKTFAFISTHARRKSTILFDYFPPSVAAGTSRLIEARKLSAALNHIGESVLFGIDPLGLGDYLNRRGFRLVKNMPAGECRPIYFKGPNRRRIISGMFVFAQATVK